MGNNDIEAKWNNGAPARFRQFLSVLCPTDFHAGGLRWQHTSIRMLHELHLTDTFITGPVTIMGDGWTTPMILFQTDVTPIYNAYIPEDMTILPLRFMTSMSMKDDLWAVVPIGLIRRFALQRIRHVIEADLYVSAVTPWITNVHDDAITLCLDAMPSDSTYVIDGASYVRQDSTDPSSVITDTIFEDTVTGKRINATRLIDLWETSDTHRVIGLDDEDLELMRIIDKPIRLTLY